jgi:protein-tyrosine phosphatase
MELFQVDDAGKLFISPSINELSDWDILFHRQVDTIIDLDGEVDIGVPTVPNQYLYIYFPIFDEDLPNLNKLHAIGNLGANLVASGHRVLSHCGMGYNRSALMAGLILNKLGMSGPTVVQRLRERRPGALFNDCFAAYLESLKIADGVSRAQTSRSV